MGIALAAVGGVVLVAGPKAETEFFGQPEAERQRSPRRRVKDVVRHRGADAKSDAEPARKRNAHRHVEPRGGGSGRYAILEHEDVGLAHLNAEGRLGQGRGSEQQDGGNDQRAHEDLLCSVFLRTGNIPKVGMVKLSARPPNVQLKRNQVNHFLAMLSKNSQVLGN